MSDYECNLCDQVYVRKKCLENHIKSKHNDVIQEDQEVLEFELGLGLDRGCDQVPAQIFQKAPVMPTQDKAPFRNMDIPDDFPEMECMIDAAEELDMEQVAEAFEATLENECDQCDIHLNDNRRVIKKSEGSRKEQTVPAEVVQGSTKSA